MQTLTSGSPSYTYTGLTANVDAVLAIDGVFDGANVDLEYAMAGAPSVFHPVKDGSAIREGTQFAFRVNGVSLKVTARNARSLTNINLELT